MSTVVRLHATHTHLFPGARMRSPAAATWRKGSAAAIEFADGRVARAIVVSSSRSRRRFVLRVDPYTTARGASIPAKVWTAEAADTAASAEYRIVGKGVPA